MKGIFRTSAWVIVALGFGVAAEKPAEDDELVKITLQRIPMDERLLRLCMANGPALVLGPHVAAEVDVYMNPVALDYRRAHPDKFDYPVGSKFVKRKYPQVGAKDPDIETIMVKGKSEGAVTDWEFGMRSLPDHEPLQPAGEVSCADCHEKYEARGFISSQSENALQAYLKTLKDKEPGTKP